MKTRAVSASLVAAISLTPPALAGNQDSYYMSGQAALQAGAVTADARGGGAVWYNPAGLAEIRGLRLDVGANAFRLDFGGVPDLDPIDAKNAEITRLRSINFGSVPAAMTLTHRFGDVGVGFGLFVPTDDTMYLRSQIKETTESKSRAAELGLDAHSSLSDYYLGPAVGLRLGSGVSIGASVFANYETSLGTSVVEGNIADGEGALDAAFADHETDDWQQVGAQAVFGVQIHPDRYFSAGLTIRTPVVRLYQVRQRVSVRLVAEHEERPVATNAFDETSGFDAEVIAPTRVQLGLSRSFGRWHVSAEANYLFPFEDSEQQIETLATANARAGLRYELSPTFKIGGGLYTDRATTDPKNFTQTGLDYYGLTLGGELSTPYETVQKGDETFDPPRGLVFATGVALSYAAGFGRVVRADVVTSEDASLTIVEVPTRAVAHELILHITSSFAE
jgi:hypothetical protein